MKLKILHAFENEFELKEYLSKIKTLGNSSGIRFTEEDIVLGNVHLLYRVIKTHKDLQKIMGVEVQHAEWHYHPEPDIEHSVYTRIRGIIE